MARLFAGWFRTRALRSAAQRYNRRLGPRLRHDYGAAAFYTPGQIRAAVAACRLPMAEISIGYAAFMTEADFADVAGDADYHALRALFRRYDAPRPISAGEPAPENSDARAGYGSTPGGS